jgi:hypothetical protein
MNAIRALPANTRFPPVRLPAHRGALDDSWRAYATKDDGDRLPPGVAYPLILLMSVGGWAVIATVGLWLYRVLG